MQFNHSANADQGNTINHLAKESKISYKSGIQTHSDFDGNLMLLQLFLGKKNDELGIFRRKKYRDKIGRRNRIQGAYRRLLVSQQKILERKKIIQEHQAKIKDLNDREELTEESTDAQLAINLDHTIPPQPLPIMEEKDKIVLKKLTVDELKTYLESIRNSYKQQVLQNPNIVIAVDNIDASGYDLSGFNLDNFYFTNSNFNGAKFPSTSAIYFDNSCNLDNSDWSGTYHQKIQFGNYLFKINEEELVESINQLEFRVNKIATFDSIREIMGVDIRSANKSLTEIGGSIEDLSKKTAQKPQTLTIKNANFSGTRIDLFSAYYVDFSGSNFSRAVFKITQGMKSASFLAPSVTALDLSEAILEFYDNQGQKISEAQGFKSLDLSKINKDLKGLIPSGGVVAKEYYQKMSSGQEILILINFDPTKIPQGLLLQNIDDSVKSMANLTSDLIDDLQKIAVKIGETYYSRYDIKFATQEMLGDKKADYQIHVNLLSGVDSGFTDHCDIFALGAKEAVIVMSEFELGIDFSSILSHEIGHVMLFQHPMGTLSDLRVPSHMSYLIPMAQRPDHFNQVVANNIMPVLGYTTADQKVLEIYMKLLGREPKITRDLTRKLDSESQGLSGLYNPDGNFNNIAEVSSEIFEKDLNIVLMTPKEALAYCKMDDIYHCENSIGYDDGYAVITMLKTTGTVKSMVILDGKNPKIKIDEEELIDIRDLLIKDGFSIIDFDRDDELRIYKYSKLENSSQRNLTETNFLYDSEVIESKETESGRKISNLLGVGFFILASVVLVSAIKRGKSSRGEVSEEMPRRDIESGVIADPLLLRFAGVIHQKKQ